MAIDWAQAAVSAVPGIAAAVISAALSSRWALSRFRSERWWDRKFATYTEILRALFLVKRYVDDWVENYDTREERSEDFKKRLLDDWHVGNRAVEEASVIGNFITSQEAAEVLRRLHQATHGADPDDH